MSVELCGMMGFMTPEELEANTTTIFEAHLQKIKKGESLQAGFWTVTDDKPTFNRLGVTAEWLNSGDGKDRLFAIMRIFIEGNGMDNCFIVTEAWEFVPNETAATIPGGWESMVDRGYKKLVKGGYGKVYQVVWVVGQTPDHVVMMSRRFEDMVMNGERKLIFHGEVRKQPCLQIHYQGRSKMFGPFTEPEVEHYYKLFGDALKEKAAGE